MKDVLNDFKSCGRPMTKNEIKIKELEEENKKLRKELEELKDPCNYYQYASKLVKTNCEILQQRIDKAIEFYEEYGANLLSNGCIKKSIKTILKGEE